MHLKGAGGCKESIRQVNAHLDPSNFVMRTDAKAFYDAIEHYQLYNTLCDCVPDQKFCALVWQSLQHSVIFDANITHVHQGLSRSHPMSPLLGAIALLPLDRAMQKLPIFYLRYMDDWVLIAKTRWGLKHAIKKMYRILTQLKFKLHPDKTSIGRVSDGFDFLGYHLGNKPLAIAQTTRQHFHEHLRRLYEQNASKQRIGDYVRRWIGYVHAGGELFEEIVLSEGHGRHEPL